MKKTNLIIALLLGTMMILASCASPSTGADPAIAEPGATDTVAPSVIPSPTTEATEPVPQQADEAGMLQGNAWQWVSFTSPVEQFRVDDPANYQLTFNEDGIVSIVADCNNAIGSYAADSISIQVGPMTMAACPEGSRSDDFVKYLGSAAIYFFKDGHLFIDLFADGGTMEFAPAGSTETSTILTSIPWQWVSFTSPVEQFTVDDPANYQLTFNDDGTVNIVADCNNAMGSYTGDGSSISIQVGPMTMAACPEGSRSDDFVKYLRSAAIYFIKDGHLFIDLFADGGTMEFAPDSDALIKILGNLNYTGVFPDKPIKLTDGYAAYSEGGTGTPHVSLVDNMIFTGDLNEDGKQDAVLFLEDDSEGTGRLTDLVVVLNVWTDPQPVDAVMVADRSGVKSMAVDGSQVVMDIVTQGPGDADCCATWNVHLVYALENGQLIEKSRKEINQISLEDLNGTSWRLGNPGTNQETSQPAEMITLQFKNGQISGFSGCNNYNAQVSSGDYGFNSLKIGPIVTTKKSCPESATSQENSYLDVLANTLSWLYEYGNLGLVFGTDNGQEDVIYLEPNK